MKRIYISGILMASVLTGMFQFRAVLAQKSDLPKEFRQIIPRGRIAAISDPTFVPATKAKIADNAWILGVEIDGEARAFSLNLLNSHEVVNDTIGGTAYAAVW